MDAPARFRDRTDAGRQLADAVARLDLTDPVVLALPRGGVPVGYEIARALDAPLDVFVARKLGAPGHPELGIGAIAEGGAQVVDDQAVDALGVTAGQLRSLAQREHEELERRVAHYRGDRPLVDLRGHDVVLVDDGLATGVTATAALVALATQGPRRLILAVPVCAPQTVESLDTLTDEIVCPLRPSHFMAVGLWYERFDQTSDDEVVDLLTRAHHPVPSRG